MSVVKSIWRKPTGVFIYTGTDEQTEIFLIAAGFRQSKGGQWLNGNRRVEAVIHTDGYGNFVEYYSP